jgi:hypothetical protein
VTDARRGRPAHGGTLAMGPADARRTGGLSIIDAEKSCDLEGAMRRQMRAAVRGAAKFAPAALHRAAVPPNELVIISGFRDFGVSLQRLRKPTSGGLLETDQLLANKR